MRNSRHNSYDLLGVHVHAMTIATLNEHIEQAIAARQKTIIAHHNLNGIRLCHSDETMSHFYEQSDLVHIDGMPLIWWGKLMGYPLKRDNRVTYVDWLPILMGNAARLKWRIFYVGSKPGIAEKAACKLRMTYPDLLIAFEHGYFDIESHHDNARICKSISDFETNILMVGMGMPRQEHWILKNYNQLDTNVILPAGAALDYVAGIIATPPRWMGRCGFEWLYRLVCEPQRLARRYLVEPWDLLPWMLADLRRRLKTRA